MLIQVLVILVPEIVFKYPSSYQSDNMKEDKCNRTRFIMQRKVKVKLFAN
jgi:hypothetical protein